MNVFNGVFLPSGPTPAAKNYPAFAPHNPRKSFFSFSFSGALTDQLGVGGSSQVLIRVTGFPWHPWSSMVCPVSFTYRGWLWWSGAAMFSRVTKRLHPTSLIVHTAPSDC